MYLLDLKLKEDKEVSVEEFKQLEEYEIVFKLDPNAAMVMQTDGKATGTLVIWDSEEKTEYTTIINLEMIGVHLRNHETDEYGYKLHVKLKESATDHMTDENGESNEIEFALYMTMAEQAELYIPV